jgi:hypothetical protein
MIFSGEYYIQRYFKGFDVTARLYFKLQFIGGETRRGFAPAPHQRTF